MGDTTLTITITTIISPPPGVRNFGFSICALCLLRDVEKETHKHKVLWEKCQKLHRSLENQSFSLQEPSEMNFSIFCIRQTET